MESEKARAHAASIGGKIVAAQICRTRVDYPRAKVEDSGIIYRTRSIHAERVSFNKYFQRLFHAIHMYSPDIAYIFCRILSASWRCNKNKVQQISIKKKHYIYIKYL